VRWDFAGTGLSGVGIDLDVVDLAGVCVFGVFAVCGSVCFGVSLGIPFVFFGVESRLFWVFGDAVDLGSAFEEVSVCGVEVLESDGLG
jgi:hypothetical protein